MTRVRAIDSKGDWDFGKGRQSYKKGLQAVMQLVVTHIRSWYLNCFFDVEAGIDWKNLIGYKKTENKIKASVRREILKISDVTEVTDVYLTLDEERNLTVSYEIKTIYGELDGSVLVL